MTEQQVLDAFAGQAVRLEAPIPSCTFDSGRKTAPVAIQKVAIGSTDYRACFFFDSAKLARVDLQPLQRSDASDHEFNSVEALLVEKYGKPWQRTEADDVESRWSFRTTRISVSLVKFRSIVLSLMLRYEQKPPDDANLD